MKTRSHKTKSHKTKSHKTKSHKTMAQKLAKSARYAALGYLGLTAADLIRIAHHQGKAAFMNQAGLSEQSYKARSQYTKPYIDSVGILQYAGFHGVSGGIYSLQRFDQDVFNRLCTYGSLQAQSVYYGGPSDRPVYVKVGVVEDIPNSLMMGGGLLKSAEVMSRNELVAMQRLSVFGCRYAPKLYGCCRFKISRGWFMSPAYLVVAVMEKVEGAPASLINMPSMTLLKNALKDMRTYGILHYDLHLQNMIVGRNTLKIIDFGRSLVLDLPDWQNTPFDGDTYDWVSYLKDVQKSAKFYFDMSRIAQQPFQKRIATLQAQYGMNPDPMLWEAMIVDGQDVSSHAPNLNQQGNMARAQLLSTLRNSHTNVSFEGLRQPLPPNVISALKLKTNADNGIQARLAGHYNPGNYMEKTLQDLLRSNSSL